MEELIPFLFRATSYTLVGLTMEVVFAVTGIELCLGLKLDKQTPHKYLEGFTSLYMIPIHSLGMYFGFEAMHSAISELNIFVRYLIWCVMITGMEALTGFIYHKTIGFYTWDYYKLSRYKVFKEGYTLWTLLPLWGIAGLFLEQLSKFLIHLTPFVVEYLR